MKLTALLAAGAFMAPLPSFAANTPGQNALFGIIGGNVHCALQRVGVTGEDLSEQLRIVGGKVARDLQLTPFSEEDMRQVMPIYEKAVQSCPRVSLPDA